MRRRRQWILGALGIGVSGLLLWAFHEGVEERGRERERERPIQASSRVTRTSEGWIVLTLDPETQARIGLRVEALAVFPERRTVAGSEDARVESALNVLEEEYQRLVPEKATEVETKRPEASPLSVLVPNSAIVRAEEKTWVYVQTGDETFERRQVLLDHSADSQWVITSGVQPGDRVVVRAAQLLLSEEFKGTVEIGEHEE